MVESSIQARIQEGDVVLTDKQKQFLAQARRIAYGEVITGDLVSIDVYQRLMLQAHILGIHQVHPLLLGDHYEWARQSARQKTNERRSRF